MIPFKPFSHQVETLKLALRYRHFALFLEPGLGKTAIIIKLFQLLQKRNKTKGMLVVAPLRPVYSTWPDEFNKWVCGMGKRVQVLHGSNKLNALRTPADVYIINFEGLKWLFEVALKRKRNWPFDMLVVDESGKFRQPDSVRRNILCGKQNARLNKFKRRYIMNGTPAPNSTIDLWGQIRVVDGGRALGHIIEVFRERHCKKGGYKGKEWFIRDDEEEKRVRQKVARLSIIKEVAECRDMPPLSFLNRNLQLPSKARKVYETAEEEMWIELENEEYEIKSDGAAILTCRQIASGAVYHPQPELEKAIPTKRRKWDLLHSVKVNDLMDLMDELNGKPILISYMFYHSLVRLKKMLKAYFMIDIPYIGSGVSGPEGKRIQNAWKAGDLPALLIHPQSGAHGLNLQGPDKNHLMWFDPTWSLEDFIQLYRRLWREGATDHVFIHNQVMLNTVDEVMMDRQDEKNDKQQDLKVALKRYRKKMNLGTSKGRH